MLNCPEKIEKNLDICYVHHTGDRPAYILLLLVLTQYNNPNRAGKPSRENRPDRDCRL